MAEFEHSATVRASAGQVFDFVADRQHLEWGADEGHDSGWLEANDRGGGQTEVTVHISLRGTPPGADPDGAPPPEQIQAGLVASLESVRRELEGGGGQGQAERDEYPGGGQAPRRVGRSGGGAAGRGVTHPPLAG